MATETHQAWLCANCVHANPEGSPDAETEAVTFVDGTALCAVHARAAFRRSRMRHD